MELYEKIDISIEYINDNDVITTSASYDDYDHDNAFLDFSELE